MKCIEFTKAYVQHKGFKILEDTDTYFSFYYQMNTIHVWGSENEEDFVMVTLPNFADVSPQNLPGVYQRCQEVNKEVKQAKLYVMQEMIIASAEIYFQEQADFDYQMQRALKNLVSAKVMYNKLDR